MPSDQSFNDDVLVDSSSESHQRSGKKHSPPPPFASLKYMLSQFQARNAWEQDSTHGWRHGDDLVFEGEDNWLDELQKGLDRASILTDEQTCDYLEQVHRSTRQWWRIGRDAGTRPTTPGLVEGSVWAECDVSGADAKEADSYDETLFRASESNIVPIVSDEAGNLLQPISQCSRLWRTDLQDTWQSPRLVRGKRFVRYFRGHSRWIPKHILSKTKCADLTSTQTATGHKRPWPQERIMRCDLDGHALSALTNCNTDGTSTLIGWIGIRCSSQRSISWNLFAIRGTRHGTKSLDWAPHRLHREQNNCMQSWAR